VSTATYLADTSAAVRLLISDKFDGQWGPALTGGLIAICDLTEIEILFSATSRTDRDAKQERLLRLFSWVPTPEGVFKRAREVQELLTDHGEHRSAGPFDLVVAATAELSELTLLHYDSDFETVARHTTLRTKWLAEPGTA
jgi:predicted nucleic acid-binding protein